MQTLNDVHHQFATFFKSSTLQPYAYLVSKKLAEGHICLDLAKIDEEAESLPEVFHSHTFSTAGLTGEHMVSTEQGQKQPFILHKNRLYLQRYFNYESIILNRIVDFINSESQLFNERVEAIRKQNDFITTLFRSANTTHQQTDWQLAAAITAVLNNFTIITGGPGTGKTTTVAKILAILFSTKENLKVALAAPTGKAAARMAESLKSASLSIGETFKERFQSLEPSTIHRLLGSIPDSPYFRHNKDNPLPYDVVIIDESSMLDVALFAKLLDAVSTNTRLILLGDKDQLASVEAGSLFGDLCQAQQHLNLFTKERVSLINAFTNEAKQVRAESIVSNSSHTLFQHIVELKHSHRFASGEGIGRFSKAIIQNDIQIVKDFLTTSADDQVKVDLSYSDKLFAEFVLGYEDYIKEPDIKTALFKFNHLRILCAIREGQQGLYAMNCKVESLLSERGLLMHTSEFYNNRPIIITSNNYALGLYNGDVGIIRPDEKGNLKAWFEDAQGNIKSIIPGLISNAETVFAMTIHKSQGSEFDKVLVSLPATDNVSILTRELLYTGVTRAKKHVLVQGPESVILKAVDEKVNRASGIAERFHQ